MYTARQTRMTYNHFHLIGRYAAEVVECRWHSLWRERRLDMEEEDTTPGYDWCKKFEISADTENNSVQRGKLAHGTHYPKYTQV